MRSFYVAALAACFIFCRSHFAHGQCNPTPCPSPIPAVNAQDACVLPNPQALDCYYGATTFDPPVSFPPYWCTVIHNNHFFAFTADAPTATFTITVFGCDGGGCLQAAVLSTSNCINFGFVSPCININPNSTATLTATGLTPGQVYYLTFDGCNGAICQYAINAPSPIINGPAGPFCLPGNTTATYTTASVSNWTISPPSAGVILGNATANSITVNWQQPGPAQVCAQSLACPNAPIECINVDVGLNTFSTQQVKLCQGKSVECAGNTYTAPGNYQVSVPTPGGCSELVTCQVSLVPTVYSTETVFLCAGQTVTCAGQEYSAAGIYNVTLSAWQGCDSVVTCRVNLVPPVIMPMQTVTLCGPADYFICDVPYSESGIYARYAKTGGAATVLSI